MPSMFQLQLRLFLKRAGFLVLFLLVAAGLYFGVQTDAWKNTLGWIANASNTGESETSIGELNETENFDAFLSRSTIQQLILRSTQLVDELELSPVERLQRQDEKVRIAEELMRRKDNDRAVKFGVATKLSALRTRELINFDNGLSTSESRELLAQLAKKNLSSFDEDTLRNANIGNLTYLIVEDLINSDQEDYTVDADAVRAFESVSKKYFNDIIVAEELYKLLKRIHIHAPEQDREKLLTIFERNFGSSRVERVKLIAIDASQQLIDSEFELLNIFDVIDARREETIGDLRKQIIDVFNRGYISQFGYERIFSGITDVARAGHYPVALELSEKLADNIRAKDTMSRLAGKTLKFKKQMRMVGKKIPLTVLEDVNGEPFQIQNPNAPMKGILFMPNGSLEKADKLLFTAMRSAGRDVSKQKFSMIAAYVDSGSNQENKNTIERLRRLVATVDVARLNTEKDDAKQLVESLEIYNDPLLLLLDEQDRVIGIGIEKQDFESRYKSLRKQLSAVTN